MSTAVARDGADVASPADRGPGADRPLLASDPADRVAFVALLVFMAFGSRIAMAQVAYATALVAFVVATRRLHRPVVWPGVLLPASLFASLTVASCLASAEPWRSLARLKEFALYGIVVVVANVVDSRRKLHAMVHALLASSVVLSVWGGVQYLTWEGRRIRGPLSHWMTYAGILVIACCFGLAFLAYHPCPRRRIAYGVVTLVTMGAIGITLTRGAWLAVAVAVVALVLLRRPALLLLAPAVVMLVMWAAPDPVKGRLDSVGEGDVTMTDRLYLWRSGARMVGDHPVLGLGLGRVKDAYVDTYRLPAAPKPSNNHLHNNLIQVAAERGLPALVAWIGIFVAAGAALARELRQPGRRQEALVGSLLATCAFLTFGLGEYNFGDSEVLMLLMFVMAIPYVERRLPLDAPPIKTPGTPGVPALP